MARAFTGFTVYTRYLIEEGQPTINFLHYISSGHFLQATFENWESEFLQMALFVIFTAFLYQQGSSESNELEPPNKPAKKQEPANAPFPVKKGGWMLVIYQYSLSLALILMFIFSFVLHLYGSWKDHSLEQQVKGKEALSLPEYIINDRFWFESFQNWQSEFISVTAIVFLSVYLRQKGSSQSKPVEAPHHKTAA